MLQAVGVAELSPHLDSGFRVHGWSHGQEFTL